MTEVKAPVYGGKASEGKEELAPLATSNFTTVQTVPNYINGVFVEPVGGEYLDNVAPATNQLIAKVPRSGSRDVDSAVQAAKNAFPEWSKLSFEQRAVWLDKIADAIERRLDELARIEAMDTGKPLSLAKRVDIPRAVANFRYFAGAIRHDVTEAHHMGDALNYTYRAPVGIAGLITPWNLPLYLLSWKVAPALAMGNTVVAKPSEVTPLTAAALAEICHEVGLPPGVFNLVHGFGSIAGQAIVAHPDIRLISFTGGTVTGAKVQEIAAPFCKKLGLELGGKNATLVFADADFEQAVAGAGRAAFTNQGQVCLAGSRIFVEETIHDKFVEALAKFAQTLQPGDPMTANFGSLTSHQHRDKVEHYVELARKLGGKIVTGGKRPVLPAPFDKGAFFEPTIITGLPPDCPVALDEIFGPVVTVHSFKTEEEAIKYANLTRYGLAGSLWTSNVQRTLRIGREWQTGMVWVNCWLHRDLRVPFGGVKDSGIGREGGRHSLEFWSDARNICIHH